MAFSTLAFLFLTACQSGPPPLPYPAFIAVDELPDVFLAALPGVRAKQLAGDSQTGSAGFRILVPADWSFTTGASPAHSVEIYVLAGEIRLGEFSLTEGGYAWIPARSPGLGMRSRNGALLLYFIDNANAKSVIQTPLITNSNLLQWQPGAPGTSQKELRADPGSGSRTWLMHVLPEAIPQWQRSSQTVEGYLLSGSIGQSECVDAKVVTANYAPGGYFQRPQNTVHGGPATRTSNSATWLLRSRGKEQIETVAGCTAAP